VSHPKEVGDRTVLAVMLALQGAGYAISAPFGENTRYDLVIDDGKRLARVQCKTGRLRRGAIRFSTCSSYGHHRRPPLPRRSYQGDVDYFAVHCAETGHVYLVPIEEVSTHVEGALRIEAPRNGQRRGVRDAAPFEVARIVAKASRTLSIAE
jgi:PD-(D/E)XK endonuclease